MNTMFKNAYKDIALEHDEEINDYVHETYNKVLDQNTEVARMIWEIDDTEEVWTNNVRLFD